MKISTRLKLAELFCGVVVAIIVGVLLFTTSQMKRELLKNEQAGEVLRAVTALRYLSMEYELRHEDRSREQWQLRSTSFSALLMGKMGLIDSGDTETIAGLRRNQEDLQKLFGLLVANRHALENEQGRAEVLKELESRLSGQISNKTQAMISDALLLSELSRKAVLDAQQRANVAVIAFGLLVMLAVAATIFITLKSVTQPLEKLREGTTVVGAGNLDFVLGVHSQDEIGELARAFDGMTEKLKLTTVSRDELFKTNEALAAEILVRQQAEQKARAQLERLNLLHQITRSTGARQDLRSIFQVVIRSLEDQLPMDFVCLYLYDQPQNALVVTCVGLRNEALVHELSMTENSRISIDENGLSRCVRGQLVYEADITKVDFPFPQRLSRSGLRALVMAPLLVESTVFGVLVVARQQAHSFSSGECEFLQQLCEHVALSANQAQLYAALQQAYDDMRQTQQSVMQQERLRSLGQMASGIAHDINNAISPIALYTELLLETEPHLSTGGRNYLEIIQRAIDDVAATVARMREFYRQRETQLTLSPVNANLLIQQVVDLTRARWSDMPQQRGLVIELCTELDPDLPFFMGVEGEIREALTNLVFNAVDAMPEGGTLTLRTRVAGVPSRDGQTMSRHVFVEVSDSGVGMDEDTRRRCLEPFFTTKGERGTGLGLAMVYGMIERHSANIELESQPDVGTTVRMDFLIPPDVAEVAPLVEADTAPLHLHILVVDDDPLVLRSLRDILAFDGHSVVEADGGQAGLNIFHSAQEQGKPFDIVFTDLGMPYVDGNKVATAIKYLSPATPVVLLTGWGQRLVSDGVGPAHVDCVLSKPPRRKELRSALTGIFQNGGVVAGTDLTYLVKDQ
ncbi:signal transduction histidine kinase/ActR/RegA family two-component response regulator [Rhodoferax ferrireducens]|uniref:histidine kinase n=1 Tax=Rhodoferax ferrireducens TaxID=192843 RepID=A0ABU2CDD1_9BURK|nr:ATP-binding protein [Rhodoferax ferrireducens]MDR7379345.1 signal transduction histidine kinase/ActR/RegA family two-component response regulator [Rhodoferax ferrireducens]